MAAIHFPFHPYPQTLDNDEKTAAFVAAYGGYDPVKKTFKPFCVGPYSVKDERGSAVPMFIDLVRHIAVAAAAGVLDEQQWPRQLFASREVFDAFASELSEYDDCYRIPDFCFEALQILANNQDTGRADMLAESLVEAVEAIEAEGVKLW